MFFIRIKEAWLDTTESDFNLARATQDPYTLRYERQYPPDPRIAEAWVEVRNDMTDRWQNIIVSVYELYL